MGVQQAGSDDVRFPHPLEPYPPLVINVALTGVIPSRSMTPHVPLTPAEIVADAVRCHDVGAAVVHVHARDTDGRPTYDAAVFAEIISGIRKERPQLIVCATTSGRRYGEFDQRAAVLELGMINTVKLLIQKGLVPPPTTSTSCSVLRTPPLRPL